MEAKSQQNFYNKTAIIVISSRLSFWSIHFQDLVQKVTKWVIIINYFRFMLCKPSHCPISTWHIFIVKFTGYMRSRHEILSHSCSRVQQISHGFDTAGYRFQTRQSSLSHTCSIGLKSGNKLSLGRLAMFC